MAAGLGGRRGCLAAAALPFLVVTAPVAAWRRRRATRRRGQRILHRLERTAFGDLARLRCELDVPSSRVAETLEMLSGLVAEGAAAVGLTVGCVGVVRGEEPVLVALAPRRDLVAGRVLAALAADDSHRHPQVWLSLTRGAYLAKVVDPYAPFAADERSILAVLRTGGAANALVSEVVPGPVGTRILLAAYAPRPMLRMFLKMSRRALGPLPGWSPAARNTPAAPRTA